MRKSALIVPQRVTSKPSVPHNFGRSSGSNPSALIARSASASSSAPGYSLLAPGGRSHQAAPRRMRTALTPETEPSPVYPLGAVSHSNCTPSSSAFCNFALRAGHVGAVAAVEAFHRLRALSNGGPHTVHGRIAAADDDNILALSIQFAAIKLRHIIAKAFAVRGCQIVDGLYDAVSPAPGPPRSRDL